MAETTNTPAEVKPGYKTTEFWLVLLGNCIVSSVAYLETIDGAWAAVAVVILNSIYALSRMGVKASAAKGEQPQKPKP